MVEDVCILFIVCSVLSYEWPTKCSCHFQSFFLRNDIFTDVLFQAATHLVVPLPLCSNWKSNTALPLVSCRLLLGAVPVQKADWHAVHINILAFFHYVCHTNPEVLGSWSASLCIVPQFIVLCHVPWCCKGPSLCNAVFICFMVMFGFLNSEVTFPVSFDATEANCNHRAWDTAWETLQIDRQIALYKSLMSSLGEI